MCPALFTSIISIIVAFLVAYLVGSMKMVQSMTRRLPSLCIALAFGSTRATGPQALAAPTSLLSTESTLLSEPIVEDVINANLNHASSADLDAIEHEPSDISNRMFALIIGVDAYVDSQHNLSGAVNDARNVMELMLNLRPPVNKERIVFLQDEAATADGITRALVDLCTNDNIKNGDPILIYYAGHGSTLPRPAGWASMSPRVQCLAPHDARVEKAAVVGVIPDYTIGALLGRIANAKGDNITVILDCCHSGSGTRNQDAVQRSISFESKDGKKNVTISPSYQRDLWAPSRRGIISMPEFSNTGLRSHIVLAACGSEESAFEDRRTHEGRFTAALLRVLREVGPDTLTYAELIRRIDCLPSQTPRCEGHGMETRILFNSSLRQRGRPHYQVTGSESSFTILAGEIHGVTEGDIFDVYSNEGSSSAEDKPLGSLVIEATSAVSSSAKLIDGSEALIPRTGCVATLSRVHSRGAFRVYVDIDIATDGELRSRVLRAMVQVAFVGQSASRSWACIAVASKETAHMSIAQTAHDAVSFGFIDERVRALGIEHLGGPVLADDLSLRSALRSAAHFFRYLGSSPSSANLRQAVSVTIWELQAQLGRSAAGAIMQMWSPTGKPIDARRCGVFRPSLCRMVKYTPLNTMYGVEVLNKTSRDLFVWMFYFDCGTLEIINFYSPPLTTGAGEADPPLPAGMTSALPLNFGDSGGVPLAFALPPGQSRDAGFLRIFVSTRYADLSGVAQEPVAIHGKAKGSIRERFLGPVPDAWEAITLAVVME